MRLPLPRLQFTIKRMMILAAVRAVVIGALRIVWLRYSYLRLAAHFAITEDLYREIQRFEVATAKNEEELALPFDKNVSADDREQLAAKVRMFQEQIEYFAALRQKYERSTAHSWLAVDPDPPPPQTVSGEAPSARTTTCAIIRRLAAIRGRSTLS
jgi:hypothetical protein